MKRVLCVWFPNWPIQRLTAERPELLGRPLVLHAERGTRGSFVTACSAEARAIGVRAGMPLAEAAALAGPSVPDARRELVRRVDDPAQRPDRSPSSSAASLLLPHERTADLAALTALGFGCSRFTPRVALEEAEFPESLLLDIAGCAHLFGGEHALAAELAADLQTRGYHPRLAIADTLAAAWAVAHYGAPPRPAAVRAGIRQDAR